MDPYLGLYLILGLHWYTRLYPQLVFSRWWSINLFPRSSILSCPLILIGLVNYYAIFVLRRIRLNIPRFISYTSQILYLGRLLYYEGLGRLCSLPTQTFNIWRRGNWLSTKIYAFDLRFMIFYRKSLLLLSYDTGIHILIHNTKITSPSQLLDFYSSVVGGRLSTLRWHHLDRNLGFLASD